MEIKEILVAAIIIIVIILIVVNLNPTKTKLTIKIPFNGMTIGMTEGMADETNMNKTITVVDTDEPLYAKSFDTSMMRDTNREIDMAYRDITGTPPEELAVFDSDSLPDWHLL